MIDNHNKIVGNDDIVLMVGDLSAGLRGRQSHFRELLGLLKGKLVLVRGNHDREPDQFYLDAGFIAVVDRFVIGDTYISHYPCYASRWTKKIENEHINFIKNKNIKNIIHGHIHNKDPSIWEDDGIKRLNVCVDFTPNNFFPVLINDEKVNDFIINKYN